MSPSRTRRDARRVIGIRRVAVRDREQPPGRADAGDEVARLGGVVRHRLVGNDVEARVEGRHGKRVVRVVGRHDGDAVDAVGPRPFRARSSPRRRRSSAPRRRPPRYRRRASGRGRSKTRPRRRPTSHQAARRPGASARSTNRARRQSCRAAAAFRTSPADRSSSPPRRSEAPASGQERCRVAYIHRNQRRARTNDTDPQAASASIRQPCDASDAPSRITARSAWFRCVSGSAWMNGCSRSGNRSDEKKSPRAATSAP